MVCAPLTYKTMRDHIRLRKLFENRIDKMKKRFFRLLFFLFSIWCASYHCRKKTICADRKLGCWTLATSDKKYFSFISGSRSTAHFFGNIFFASSNRVHSINCWVKTKILISRRPTTEVCNKRQQNN